MLNTVVKSALISKGWILFQQSGSCGNDDSPTSNFASGRRNTLHTRMAYVCTCACKCTKWEKHRPLISRTWSNAPNARQWWRSKVRVRFANDTWAARSSFDLISILKFVLINDLPKVYVELLLLVFFIMVIKSKTKLIQDSIYKNWFVFRVT